MSVFTKRTYNIYRHQCKRAGKLDDKPDYTLEEFRDTVQARMASGTCAYCHRPMGDANFSCDHRTPISRGGKFSKDNIMICCEVCNQAKGRLTWEEYMDLLDAMVPWPEEARKDLIRRLRAGNRMFAH